MNEGARTIDFDREAFEREYFAQSEITEQTEYLLSPHYLLSLLKGLDVQGAAMVGHYSAVGEYTGEQASGLVGLSYHPSSGLLEIDSQRPIAPEIADRIRGIPRLSDPDVGEFEPIGAAPRHGIHFFLLRDDHP